MTISLFFFCACVRACVKVVLTDYPDQALIDNLVYNVAQNVEPARRGAVCVLGYVWGHPLEPLLGVLDDRDDRDDVRQPGTSTSTSSFSFFDLILLSDLIFNHSQVLSPLWC